jgi:thiamine biosynthesis lipoprotein
LTIIIKKDTINHRHKVALGGIKGQKESQMKKQKIILSIGLLAVLFLAGMGARYAYDAFKSASFSASADAEINTDVQEASADAAVQDHVEQRQIFAMDTYMTVQVYGENAKEAADAAVAEIERLDALFSIGSEDSEITQLNENGETVLSEETFSLIERAISFYKKTDGAFDLTVLPLMELWGFTSGDYHVPDEETLEETKALLGADEIALDKETNTATIKREGVRIDLGGIAKGYTSAKVTELLRDYGVTSALLNLGGNVQTLGKKTDGSLWSVAIQAPDGENLAGILHTADKAVITSGGYERYFEEDGTTYHHILDPQTGYPAQNGLVSVTIVTEDGTMADALSTALYVMGTEKAVAYLQEHAKDDGFDAVLIAEDGSIYITQGLASDFESLMEGEIHIV